ncbi:MULTISPECIES: hypothetical protein [Flavobacteriaceae]|uniref:hypothetical protein n=1 Tax=Flavobacteriaceae TaxID=49546 RepID=UPI003A91644D
MFFNSSFCRPKSVKGIYLHDLSRRLGVPSETIIQLLEGYGFNIDTLPTNYLNSEHLDIILKAYVNSVKSAYKNQSKSFKNGQLNDEGGWRNFFSKFIRPEFSFSQMSFEDTIKMVFREKLDDDLIIDYFWTVLSTSRLSNYNIAYGEVVDVENHKSIYSKYRYKIKLLVRKNSQIKDFRSQIKSILISSHYYIFSSEDEDSNESTSHQYFSRINNLIREALNFINNLKFHKKWIIIYKTSLTT